MTTLAEMCRIQFQLGSFFPARIKHYSLLVSQQLQSKAEINHTDVFCRKLLHSSQASQGGIGRQVKQGLCDIFFCVCGPHFRFFTLSIGKYFSHFCTHTYILCFQCSFAICLHVLQIQLLPTPVQWEKNQTQILPSFKMLILEHGTINPISPCCHISFKVIFHKYPSDGCTTDVREDIGKEIRKKKKSERLRAIRDKRMFVYLSRYRPHFPFCSLSQMSNCRK